MNEIETAEAAKYTDKIIAQAFLDEPDFISEKHEPYFEYMDKYMPGMSWQSEMVSYLKHYRLVDCSGDFTEYAVSNGLVIQAISRNPFSGNNLIIQKEWYITAQGKIFIKQLFQDNTPWQ